MPRVELKGIAKVTSKGRDYWYAWRGGPRLRGEPGTPEFMASYNEAVESLKATNTDKFHSVVVQYRTDAFKGLAVSTRSKWAPWVDRIDEYFGNLRTVQFDRAEKIRPVIIRFRNQWSDKPRTADYGIQVLSHILSYAVDPLTKITKNPCNGQDRSGPEGSRPAFPRPARNRSHQVLRRGHPRTGDCRDHGLGREAGSEDHQTLRRTDRLHGGTDPTTQLKSRRKENIACKTVCKTFTPEMG